MKPVRITKDSIDLAVRVREELFPGERGKACFEESFDNDSDFAYDLSGGANAGMIGRYRNTEDRESARRGWFGIRKEHGETIPAQRR